MWPSLPSRWNRFHQVLKTRAMCTQCDSIGFCKFYSEILLPFRSQTLANCTSLDSLRCVVYIYNRLKVICATSKHLEKDKCWQVGCSYGNLNRPVVYIHLWSIVYNNNNNNVETYNHPGLKIWSLKQKNVSVVLACVKMTLFRFWNVGCTFL